MTSVTGNQVFLAFVILVGAVVLIGGAPLMVAGVWGHELADSLISNSDKTVSGLMGILGTLVGLTFRRQPGDNTATENVGKAFDAITAAANSTPTPVPDAAGQAADQVADAAADKADEIKGDG